MSKTAYQYINLVGKNLQNNMKKMESSLSATFRDDNYLKSVALLHNYNWATAVNTTNSIKQKLISDLQELNVDTVMMTVIVNTSASNDIKYDSTVTNSQLLNSVKILYDTCKIAGVQNVGIKMQVENWSTVTNMNNFFASYKSFLISLLNTCNNDVFLLAINNENTTWDQDTELTAGWIDLIQTLKETQPSIKVTTSSFYHEPVPTFIEALDYYGFNFYQGADVYKPVATYQEELSYMLPFLYNHTKYVYDTYGKESVIMECGCKAIEYNHISPEATEYSSGSASDEEAVNYYHAVIESCKMIPYLKLCALWQMTINVNGENQQPITWPFVINRSGIREEIGRFYE